MKKKHCLETIIDKVEKTHKGLGELIALEALVVKSHKLLIVVAPHGTGKSRASSFVGQQSKTSLLFDRLSVAGLATMAEEISGFNGVVVVDDIAKTQTPYARINTMTTLAELVYSHYVSSHMSKLQFEIRDFNGSAIVNIQPVLLKSLVASAEWEASMQDKAIRYYHLRRPLDPVLEPPQLKIEWGLDIDKVSKPNLDTKLADLALRTSGGQWGRARTKEHIGDLARAAAAIDGRTKVAQQDFKLLLKLLKPLKIESAVMDKQDFEAKRELHSNKLAIMTEFISYGQFTIYQLAEDYNISASQAYRLMQQYSDDWNVVHKSPVTYAPSDKWRARLERQGVI